MGVEQEEGVTNCANAALAAGGVAAVKAFAVAGSLWYAAQTYSPFFRNQFSASAKTALLVMPIFYTTWINVELSMSQCMKKKMAPDYSDQDDS